MSNVYLQEYSAKNRKKSRLRSACVNLTIWQRFEIEIACLTLNQNRCYWKCKFFVGSLFVNFDCNMYFIFYSHYKSMQYVWRGIKKIPRPQEWYTAPGALAQVLKFLHVRLICFVLYWQLLICLFQHVLADLWVSNVTESGLSDHQYFCTMCDPLMPSTESRRHGLWHHRRII